MTKNFETTVEVDATQYGLSDKIVGVSFDGMRVTVGFERDGRHVQVHDEPGSRDELERLAALAERDPHSYANETIAEWDESIKFDAEVYADHVMDGWEDNANDSYEPTLANALQYFDGVVALEMHQSEPIRHQPSAHSNDLVEIAAPDDDEEFAEARAHFERFAKVSIKNNVAA